MFKFQEVSENDELSPERTFFSLESFEHGGPISSKKEDISCIFKNIFACTHLDCSRGQDGMKSRP
jgi:hypothetical protein